MHFTDLGQGSYKIYSIGELNFVSKFNLTVHL